MRIRPLLYPIIIMMGWSYLTLAAEEDSYKESLVEDMSSDDKQTINTDTMSKKLPEGIISTRVIKKQKGRSIKMIVGGQSEDGLAKQVNLPVED